MDAGFLDGDGPRTRGRSGAMKELRVVWRDQKSDNEDASNLEERGGTRQSLIRVETRTCDERKRWLRRGQVSKSPTHESEQQTH